MSDRNAIRIAGTVLVADDHAMFRYGLVQFLRTECGVGACREADTLGEALAGLADETISLAICDLGMPDVDSPIDLAAIRRLRPDVRLVVLTGSDDRQAVLQALTAGVHGYIVKTAQLDALAERLARVMAGEIYVPPLVADLPAEQIACKQVAVVRPAPEPAVPGDPSAQPLSDRQRQVLIGIVDGKSNKEIARLLDIAEGTVKMHVGALYRTLGATNRAHAASLGRRFLD